MFSSRLTLSLPTSKKINAMKGVNNIRKGYHEELKEIYNQLITNRKEIRRISTARGVIFIIGLLGGIFASSMLMKCIIVTIALVLFLYLVKIHTEKFKEKAYNEKKQLVLSQELDAMDLRYNEFDDGKEFIDINHLYSHDLDLFGPQSLFQYINRTVTQPGKKRLADWMMYHLRNRQAIIERQEAVQELSEKREFRQHFRAMGLLYEGEHSDTNELIAWATSPSRFSHNKWLQKLPAIITTTNLLCLLSVTMGWMSGTLWGIIWVSILTFSTCFSRQISRLQEQYGKKLKVLNIYSLFLKEIEETPLEAKLLKTLKNKTYNERVYASKTIEELNSLMNALDQRNNYLVYAILNGTFFWEVHQMIRIEIWKEKYGKELGKWLNIIAETDALCSLATYAYNNPDYTYPIIASTKEAAENKETPFKLIGKAMGHPLMERNKCIRNDIQMEKQPAFIIITGANMAGKSTYLRTIGVNYLLACIGAPTCTENTILYPAQLITNLRTTDSLKDNESYFFAELKRLKLIIDKLNEGEELFIILDEILKGTNSIDKQQGSEALIRQFMKLNTNGIIATHDLTLGKLADSFPGKITNYCFEAEIKQDELTFNYQIKEGIAQNMNACFLMKKMGIAIPG